MCLWEVKSCIVTLFARAVVCWWVVFKGVFVVVAGVIRESYQKERDQMVPVTLLAIAVILAFVMGAVFSGLVVYCVCDQRRRHFETSSRHDKELPHSRRGSMNSVTKLTGLFETGGGGGGSKDPRAAEAILTPLMHNGRLATAPNGKMLIKADQHLDLSSALPPTPEATPMQPRRKPSRGSREWERNQNLINACAKDLGGLGSPTLIPTDLPLRSSPGHIPSVVVLPLPQHQLQAYQHEYVEHPGGPRSDLGPADDQGATLEYKTMKSPCPSGLTLVEDGEGGMGMLLPPRVPQREASLGVNMPPAVPQMGKRLEAHAHDHRRGYALKASAAGLKRHNTNSSNSSQLARNHSFSRAETPPPPPAPQRVDSILMTTLSRAGGSYGSLPRCGARLFKPDVPPKPSPASLVGSSRVKSPSSDSSYT